MIDYLELTQIKDEIDSLEQKRNVLLVAANEKRIRFIQDFLKTEYQRFQSTTLPSFKKTMNGLTHSLSTDADILQNSELIDIAKSFSSNNKTIRRILDEQQSLIEKYIALSSSIYSDYSTEEEDLSYMDDLNSIAEGDDN